MKKILSCALALAFVVGLSALPPEIIGKSAAGIAASAQDEIFESGDYKYRVLADGTIEITDADKLALDVPSEIDGRKVTSIGDNAFSGSLYLDKVTIPDSVKSIGEGAFMGSWLTSVVIPDGITRIENSTFDSCEKLSKVEIPDSVTSIGERAFQYCYRLSDVVLPDGVTSIGDSAYMNCTNLYIVLTLPDSLTSIGRRAFANCSHVQSVIIPDGVTVIEPGTFSNCSELKYVGLPKNLKSIKSAAFNGCSILPSLTIPDSVTDIGEKAFCGCTELKEVTIPKNVKNIEEKAFGYYTVIYDFWIDYPKMKGLKLYCYSGTAGEQYAKSNSIEYELLDAPTPTPTPTPSKPSTPTAQKYTSTTNAVRINWNKVSGASGYRVYKYNTSTKKWDKVKDVSAGTLTYKFTGLKAGTTYKYKVKAYTKSGGQTVWGNASSTITTATKPAKPTITKASKSASAVRLYWNKVSGASGYKLQQYDNASKKWKTVKVLSSTDTNYKVSGLKSNTAYKFRIQAYKSAGGQKTYSAWSTTKKATTKK